MRPIGFLTITDSCGNINRTTVTANEYGLLTINSGGNANSNYYKTTALPFSVYHGGGTNAKIMAGVKAALLYRPKVETYVEPEPFAE